VVFMTGGVRGGQSVGLRPGRWRRPGSRRPWCVVGMPPIDRKTLRSDGSGSAAAPRDLGTHVCAFSRAPRHVPLSCDDRGAWNERDRMLLARIAHARLRGDERSARLAAGELLIPYLPGVQALVARRTAWMRVQQRDREEIVSIAIERLLHALAREPELKGAPFGAVATTKVADAIVDFLRARKRHVGERLTAPEDFPDLPAGEASTPVEQAAAADTILSPLRRREREIVYERYVLELDAGEVAGRRDMSTAAVKMTCSRGLRKIRDALQRGDVTFSDPPSESGSEGSLEEEAGSGGFLNGVSNHGNNPDPHGAQRHEGKVRHK
jgi:RNA polymerase sigma factor (sigma-70 family)